MKTCHSLVSLFFSLLICFQGTATPTVDVLPPAPAADSIPSGYTPPGPRSFLFPGSLMAYGILKPVIPGIGKLDDRIWRSISTGHPNFSTHADTYLQWAPGASVFLLDAFKVRTSSGFRKHLAIEAGSLAFAGAAGFVMRRISRGIPAFNTHPETQFPSGHTTNAFRGAEILHQELKISHPVWSYSGYVVATAVGLMRMYNKEHLLSEVIAGAGLGILSTRFTYWSLGLLEKRKRSRKSGSRP